MSTKSTFSIGTYLRSRPGPRITALLQRATWLQELTNIVRRQLPPELAERCEVVDYKNNRLVLLTHSPVWAARLRFAAADLGKRLALEGLEGIRRTEVRVTPASRPREPRTRRYAPHLSSDNARLLKQAARGVKDKKLADALRRLAERSNAGKTG